jgi:hypothetical protein
MQFRWIALITLWTVLVGPIVGTPAHSPQGTKAVRHTSTATSPQR